MNLKEGVPLDNGTYVKVSPEGSQFHYVFFEGGKMIYETRNPAPLRLSPQSLTGRKIRSCFPEDVQKSTDKSYQRFDEVKQVLHEYIKLLELEEHKQSVQQKLEEEAKEKLEWEDALKKYDADVIRFLMLSGHYRIQLNFSEDLLESAKSSVERLYNAVGNLENLISEVKVDEMTKDEQEYLNSLDAYRQRYIEKMDDDFNTADAISVLFDLIRDINSNVGINSSKELCEKALELIRELGSPLGILQKTTKGNLEEEIEALIAERQQARKDRNFALADKIRDDLKGRGIELLDTPQGVRWKKVD